MSRPGSGRPAGSGALTAGLLSSLCGPGVLCQHAETDVVTPGLDVPVRFFTVASFRPRIISL